MKHTLEIEFTEEQESDWQWAAEQNKLTTIEEKLLANLNLEVVTASYHNQRMAILEADRKEVLSINPELAATVDAAVEAMRSAKTKPIVVEEEIIKEEPIISEPVK